MGKNAIDSSVVVKNIESKLKELKLSKAEFYRESGITSATLSNWRSETWLMGYDVPMEPQKQAAPQPTPIPPGFQPMPEMTTVPIVGRIRWWEGKSRELAPGSLKSYVPCVARAVEVFGGYRMNEITGGDIAASAAHGPQGPSAPYWTVLCPTMTAGCF